MKEQRLNCPQHGERLMDLDGPELMCPDCRVVGPDGKPLGWDDGQPTAIGADDHNHKETA